MPIDESAIAGQKIGTFARYAAVRMPSRPVVFQRWPPSRYRNSRVVYGRGSSVAAKSAIQLSLPMNSSSLAIRVVDAIDALLRQRGIVGVRASRGSDAGRASRADRDTGSRRWRRGSRRSGSRSDARRSSRRPPARQRAGHPQENRHIVLEHLLPDRDAPSRDCDPETRSAPCARGSASAVRPASTTNGSIGVCRKRDFFFMRAQL